MIRSHDPNVGLSYRQRVPSRLPIVEQLCDAEIQQFWDARRRHENIRWLQIAMNNEILVGVVNRAAYHLEQFES
jgi:hypothetical protein